VKRKDLERELTKLGWHFKRHGANHDIWSDGEHDEPLPRHNEIKEFLAKKIIKKAQTSFLRRK
jgi:mRNA interferase HicA